jgi:hypothetical protein
MKTVCGMQFPALTAWKAITLLAFSLLATPSRAEEASVEALKAGIEGAYVLEEWHRDGGVLRPPVVEARTVLLNGLLTFIAFDRAKEDNKTAISGYAKYILEPGKFSYGYEGWTAVAEKASGPSVSHDLPWQGLRTFTASIENNEIRFRATDGPQEFRFSANSLSYSDGKQTRVYRRMSDR